MKINSCLPSGLDSTAGKPKQSTRMIKLMCFGCGYTIRTTAKWLKQSIPICSHCDQAFDLAD